MTLQARFDRPLRVQVISNRILRETTRLMQIQKSITRLMPIVCIVCLVARQPAVWARQVVSRHSSQRSPVGSEIAVPEHMRDGEEFQTSLRLTLAQGKLLF